MSDNEIVTQINEKPTSRDETVTKYSVFQGLTQHPSPVLRQHHVPPVTITCTFKKMQMKFQAYELLQDRRDKLEEEIKVLLELLKEMDENLKKRAEELKKEQMEVKLDLPSCKDYKIKDLKRKQKLVYANHKHHHHDVPDSRCHRKSGTSSSSSSEVDN